MIIHDYVDKCDATGEEYETPVLGGHVVARGATGRWCVVLYVGPEALDDMINRGYELVEPEDAYEAIKAHYQTEHDYPDF